MNVGSQIKKYRLEKGISQNRLAGALNVTAQAVSKWELGNASPDIDLLPKIADFLGVSVDDLFEHTSEKRLNEIATNIYMRKQMDADEFAAEDAYIGKILARNPDDGNAKMLLGNLFLTYSRQLERRAIELGKAVIKQDPGNEEAFNIVNNAFHGANYNWSESTHRELIAYLRAEFQRSKKNNIALPYLLDNLIADNRFDEAEAFVLHTKGTLSKEQRTFYKLYIEGKRCGYTSVKERFKALAKKKEIGFDIIYMLAKIAAENQDYGFAISLWEQAYNIQKPPHLLDPLEQIAYCYEYLGNYEAAIQTYEKLMHVLEKEWNTFESEDMELYKIKIAGLQLQMKP